MTVSVNLHAALLLAAPVDKGVDHSQHSIWEDKPSTTSPHLQP